MIDDETVVITLQNGIGNVETISEFVDKEQIVFGVTTLGSVVKGPGQIEATVTEGGQTYLWSVTGKPKKTVRSIIDTCNRAGLNFSLAPDVKERIWKKLCLNAGLSVPLAIPRLKCGDYIEQPHSLELTRGLVQEIVAVAEHEDVKLDPEEMYENVVNLAKQSPNHRTSILMDVVNHRKTEIDCLNGAVVSKAREYGIQVPFNSVICNIIRVIEDTYDKSIRRDPNG
jgi:2-dehydropantoate 2-reductase